jgi:hypothetical protein
MQCSLIGSCGDEIALVWRLVIFEDRQVLALRNGDNHRLVFALIGEVVFQFHSQYAGLGADNVVFVGVVACGPSVNMDANLLLRSFFWSLFEGATGDMEKKGPEFR